MRKQAVLGEETGETLIELLVSVVIMGTAVVVLLGGLATSIRLSVIHREQAVAGAQVRAFAEAVETAVAASPSAYVACAGTAAYGGVYTPLTGYTSQVTEVRYWSGSAFDASCTTDSGVQRVTLSVHSADAMVDESLVIVIRKPCRPTALFSGDALCS
jgi:type II secretory pathway pseudopilin PulG